MTQHLLHGYSNLPTTVSEWNAIVEPAKDAYWNARRAGENESQALLHALNAVVVMEWKR